MFSIRFKVGSIVYLNRKLAYFIKMWRSRIVMSKRWRQRINSESIQDFETEDLPIEIPRAQPPPDTSHLDGLSLLRASTPVPVLQTEELPCSSTANLVSLPSISQLDYMPFKSATELIPRFDGTTCSLTSFISQCRDIYSKIKPTARVNLLTVIRYKMEGEAKLLMENHATPDTLEELISLLKTIFEQTFDVGRIEDELKEVSQRRDETIRSYGARVSAILSCGIEAVRAESSAEQLAGNIGSFERAAVRTFIQGLYSEIVRVLIRNER